MLTPDFLKAFDRNFEALSQFSCAEREGSSLTEAVPLSGRGKGLGLVVDGG